jgi:hypothetical protein
MELKRLQKEFKRHSKNQFNVQNFDRRLDQVAKSALKHSSQPRHSEKALCSGKVGFLASKVLDTGGHSVCLENAIKSFKDSHQSYLFLSRIKRSYVRAPQRMSQISAIAAIQGVQLGIGFQSEIKGVYRIYEKIVSSGVASLFLFIHPADVVAVTVVAMLKATTKVRVFFFNHADHLPVLGMAFSDSIIEPRTHMQGITHTQRGYDNTIHMPLQATSQSVTKYLTDEQKQNLRTELGVPKNVYFSLSGGASYKMFSQKTSLYLEMIKELLEQESNLVHGIVTKFSRSEKVIFHKIFEDNPDLLKRLIIIPFQKDFDKLFQACDVFIDSFPQGAALTLIDVMRNKNSVVVKINPEDPTKSFECYLPDAYEYAVNDSKSMIKATLTLLKDQAERDKISVLLYDHYKSTFAFEQVQKQYVRLANNL